MKRKIFNLIGKMRRNLVLISILFSIVFGLTGIFFGVYQIYQSRREMYFQYRPYVNLKNANISTSPKEIYFEIENRGLSVANDIMIGIAEVNNNRK